MVYDHMIEKQPTEVTLSAVFLLCIKALYGDR